MKFQFSYVQQEYDETKEYSRRLGWKNKEKLYQFDNCSVDVIGMDSGRSRVVIRREISGHSTFVSSDFTLNLMMGVIVTKVILETEKQLLFEVQQSHDLDHRDIRDVRMTSENKNDILWLNSEIMKNIGNPLSNSKIIDPGYFEKYYKMMPVIYQPDVDAWLNILREIQVHEKNNCYEVTLVFEDENLRRHGIFDFVYRFVRFLKYRRTVDIESFVVKDDEFLFDGIYSGKHVLFDDNIHESAQVSVKYFFQDVNHPVVFVNTSNHALGEGDNNHDFWKREYVPWSDKVPVKFGNKTRKETEKSYKRF